MVRTEVGEDTKASFRWNETGPPPASHPSAVEIPPHFARLRFHTELHQFHDADRLELQATAIDDRKGMRSAPGDLFGLTSPARDDTALNVTIRSSQRAIVEPSARRDGLNWKRSFAAKRRMCFEVR